MLKKNVAVTGFTVAMINKGNGNAITTGTVSGYVTKDGGTQTAIAGTPTHKGNGQWSVNLTATEMNGNVVGLLFTHTDAVPVNFTIPTYTDATGGAITFTYTVTESGSGNPIDNCDVWVSTDVAGSNVIQNAVTNASGVATFYLDAGTYYFWRQKNGWNFTNPDTETVS